MKSKNRMQVVSLYKAMTCILSTVLSKETYYIVKRDLL